MPLHIVVTKHNPPVDCSTYLQVLHACIANIALSQGKKIRSLITHRGFASAIPTFFQNTLINMYLKCGGLVAARKVFDEMIERDGFSWNVMIAAYRKHGCPDEALALFHQMQRTGVQPDQFTFSSILPACAKLQALKQGMNIHQSVMESGFFSDVVVASALIDMYAKCGSIQKAQEVFDKMPQRNVFSWNAIIAGYAQNGDVDEALTLFKEMPQRNVVSWNTMIAGYVQKGVLDKALRLFKQIPLRDVVSWNTMIVGYAQNGVLDEALRLFKEMPQKNVVSWTAMIAGYAHNGLVEKALETFKQMQLAGVNPNPTTFASILPACAKMGVLQQGIDIHRSIMEHGFLSDVIIMSALVDMYAKCGSIHKAQELFDKMPQKNVVSWTAMITGYAHNGLVEKGLETFKKMRLASVKPNSSTFASILPACAKMGALEQGVVIHQSVIKSGFLSDVVVVSALVDMYAKCGSIQKARGLFDKMSKQDAVSWSAMIAGYAMHGFHKDAFELFVLMKHSGTFPDHVSFVCVLFACSHAGLVDEGCKYFNDISDSYCIMPTLDHYVCMVDLLGRAGYLDKALNFIIKMPFKPAVVVWMCLLGSCRLHKNIGQGVFTATVLFELDPKNATPYVVLSNIYAEVGRWGDVQKVRGLMKDREIKKILGCSWIEVHKVVHAFYVGKRSHPQT